MKSISSATLCLALTVLVSPVVGADAKPSFLGFDNVALFDNVADGAKELVPTKPASLSFFFPDGGDKYYNVDAGLAVTGRLGGDPKDPSPIKETLSVAVHRNSGTADYNHSLVATYGVSQVWGSLTTGPLAALVAFDLPYKDDRKKGDRSFVPKLTVIPGSTSNPDGWLNGPLSIINPRHILNLDPLPIGLTPVLTLGIEREDIQRSAKRTTGHTWRGLAKYQWEITGNEAKSTWSRVVLTAAVNTWYEFDRSAAVDVGTHTRRSYEESLTFYMDDGQNFGFQIKRVDGEDPDQGKPVQHLTQAGVVIKWGKAKG